MKMLTTQCWPIVPVPGLEVQHGPGCGNLITGPIELKIGPDVLREWPERWYNLPGDHCISEVCTRLPVPDLDISSLEKLEFAIHNGSSSKLVSNCFWLVFTNVRNLVIVYSHITIFFKCTVLSKFQKLI